MCLPHPEALNDFIAAVKRVAIAKNLQANADRPGEGGLSLSKCVEGLGVPQNVDVHLRNKQRPSDWVRWQRLDVRQPRPSLLALKRSIDAALKRGQSVPCPCPSRSELPGTVAESQIIQGPICNTEWRKDDASVSSIPVSAPWGRKVLGGLHRCTHTDCSQCKHKFCWVAQLRVNALLERWMIRARVLEEH